MRLSPEDFEVERTELLTRSATVLMLDVSLSMPMRDNFLPAKKVAMALHSLITTQFPRDYFGLVAFGRVAREVKPQLLPEMSWDFEWGTNMQHAMLLARPSSSARAAPSRSSWSPTASRRPTSTTAKRCSSTRRRRSRSRRPCARCSAARAGIRINTFMLDESPYLQDFVRRMMKMNNGRAFFTSPDNLGDYVLVDFLEHRQARRRAS